MWVPGVPVLVGNLLEKANAEEMCVLTSPLTAYEICGRLAAQGIPAHG